MCHLNERQQTQGLWEEEGEQDKEAGEREREGQQTEGGSAIKGKQSTRSYRLFFLAIPRDVQNFHNQKSRLGPCIGSPVLTTGPLKESQCHIDFCVHTHTHLYT